MVRNALSACPTSDPELLTTWRSMGYGQGRLPNPTPSSPPPPQVVWAGALDCPPPVQHHLPSGLYLLIPATSPLRPPPLTMPRHLPAYLAQAAGYFHTKLLPTVKTYPIPGPWHPPEDNQSQRGPGLSSSLAHTWVPKLFGRACIARRVQHLDIGPQHCLQSSYSRTLHLSLFQLGKKKNLKPQKAPSHNV